MRPRRIALVAGIVAAVYVSTVVADHGIPDGLLALVGGPNGGVARYGGLVLRYRPPAGYDAAEYLARARSNGMPARSEGDTLVIEIPKISEDEAGSVIAIVSRGGLEFREALDDISLGQVPVVERGSHDTQYVADGVTREIDVWHPEIGGRHESFYLSARSRDELDRAIAQIDWQRPPHTIVAYERNEPSPEWRDQRPEWRTYVLGDQVLLDGAAIASAEVSYDPNTNRPIVLLDFTREGAGTFADITERIAGRKLATLVGGEVMSAPVINEPIRGGRASISMGGSNPDRQLEEANLLVKVLHTPALPRGGTVVDQKWIKPPNLAVLILLARLVVAFAAGLVGGGAMWLLVRFLAPSWRPAPAPAAGPAPLALVAATLLAPFAVIVLGSLPLPFVNQVELGFIMHGRHTGEVSPLAAGIEPLISAYLLVELVTLVVPRLYARRQDPKLRVTLGKVVAAIAVVFAVFQGYSIATYLMQMSRFGSVLIAQPGLMSLLAITAAIVSATLLLALAAGAIREYGLGNGYGVVIATAWLVKTAGRVIDDPATGHLVGIVAFAAIGCATWFILRARVGAATEAPLRMPTSGTVPLSDAAAVVGIIGVLVTVGWIPHQRWLDDWTLSAHHRGWILLLVVGGFAVVWSFVFARPGIAAKLAVRAKLQPTSMASWRRATVLSGVVLIAIAAIEALTNAVDSKAAVVCDATMAMVVTAVALDVVDELRARRRALVAVWPLHQVQHAEVVAHALREAGIPFHFKGGHLRTLLAFFGPYVPIDVMVPADQAAEARSKIAWLYEETPLAAFE